jgi:hypothetical protein
MRVPDALYSGWDVNLDVGVKPITCNISAAKVLHTPLKKIPLTLEGEAKRELDEVNGLG